MEDTPKEIKIGNIGNYLKADPVTGFASSMFIQASSSPG